jgi:hypothetical protein
MEITQAEGWRRKSIPAVGITLEKTRMRNLMFLTVWLEQEVKEEPFW